MMIGLVRGRIYYNLDAWYRVVSLLPGYRWNRSFMEQMMGVRRWLIRSRVSRAVASGRCLRSCAVWSDWCGERPARPRRAGIHGSV